MAGLERTGGDLIVALRVIIDTPAAHDCDVIVMVKHVRGVFGEFLRGSQAKTVLASSKLLLLPLRLSP